MATYNNPHWLLSHIRNSFIATDDTGMCEQVMLSEDLPNQLASNQNSEEIFYCYPGLENSDNEELDFSNSYEIQMDQNIGFHRQRSNTAQKLDRMEQARKRAAKIKYVKVDDVTSAQLIAADTDTKLFQRKILPTTTTTCIQKPTASLLSYQIENCPKQPHNKFLEYAKFDGTAQTASVLFKVFLTMIPQRKNYPMPICVSSTAKIDEFIGFICYKCSIHIPNSEDQLINFENFGLFIAEENGEIELGFPPLDKREVCSRFCFTFLSLVECKPVSEQAFDPCPSLTSEAENAGQALLTEMKNQQLEDVVLLSGHITDIEAPLYKIYRVYIVSKAVPIFRSSVQLGISGEKIEIDPEKKSKIWVGQKAVSYPMDSICAASSEDIESKGNKSIFRIIYCVDKTQKLLNTSGTSQKSNMGMDYHASSMSSPSQSSSSSSNEFKHYDFETSIEMSNEIVQKINKILDLRSSLVRKKYLESKEKRKFRTRRPFN